MGRLDGKVAVIVGASGSGSMGQQTARAMAAEGAKVVVAARRKEPLEALAADIGGTAIACDISDEAQVEAVAKCAVDTYGGLDIAVNFAGLNVQSPVAEIDAEKLKDAIDIHFVGSVLFIKHMANSMAASGGGSVITTSTLTATLGSPGMAAYAGTKAGVDNIVRIAATEYGKANVKVNSITPSLVRSEMTEGVFAQMPAVAKAFENETRLPRLATVDDIANLCVFLGSDESFITAQNIQINGGADMGHAPTPGDFAAAGAELG